MYAVKIVASFYTVQHEHVEEDMVGSAYVLASNSLGHVSAIISEIGPHMTNISQKQDNQVLLK